MTAEDRRVLEYGINHNLGIRLREATENALAEIDSLRVENERLRADSDLLATAVRRACYTNEEGEVDSLTPFELLDQFQDKLTNAYRQLAEIDRLRAENERLRGAGE